MLLICCEEAHCLGESRFSDSKVCNVEEEVNSFVGTLPSGEEGL
jgi:hypothetical protein